MTDSRTSTFSACLENVLRPSVVPELQGELQGGRREEIVHRHNTIVVAGFSASGAVGHTSAQSSWLRASWYYQVHGHWRDGVTAAFSAHNNNNSTLPTKLLELSSEDLQASRASIFVAEGRPTRPTASHGIACWRASSRVLITSRRQAVLPQRLTPADAADLAYAGN